MRWMLGMVVGLTSVSSVGLALVPSSDSLRGSNVRYQVKGDLGYRIRKVTGPVTRWVQGVPAAPVDSFSWDGSGRVPVEGSIVIECDPVTEQGSLQAQWTDEYGEWGLNLILFLNPEHPSGRRIDRTVNTVDTIINEAIVTNVYLHGDTTAGMPVLPTVYTYLAAWGLSEVTLNGEHFNNEIDGIQMPFWDTHIMVTAGARDVNDGTVRTWDGNIYDMTQGSNGLQDHSDLEFHMVFHDGRFPTDPTNNPPLFEFFYHLIFEEVQINIRHRQPLK